MKEKILELINKYNKLEVGYECDKISSRLQCDVAIDLCSNFKNDLLELYDSEESIIDRVKESVDKHYLKEYQTNPLFNKIINDIIENDEGEDKIIDVLINIIYSYNTMYCSVIDVVSKTTDEETIKKLYSQMHDIANDENK